VGVINVYTCAACGYRAEVHDGSGFFASNEIRLCRATSDLVGVTVSVHSHRDKKPPAGIVIDACPECGNTDLSQPTRIGALRRVACPRCGEATQRSSAGSWD
jgi:predicted RNA-binding Zn-ribbon protein involved in translation (DUF1610 family)